MAGLHIIMSFYVMTPPTKRVGQTFSVADPDPHFFLMMRIRNNAISADVSKISICLSDPGDPIIIIIYPACRLKKNN